MDLHENLKNGLSKNGSFRSRWQSPGSCGGKSKGEGKPKCLPAAKAYAMGKKKRKTSAARKRRKDPDADRRGKAKNVKT